MEEVTFDSLQNDPAALHRLALIESAALVAHDCLRVSAAVRELNGVETEILRRLAQALAPTKLQRKRGLAEITHISEEEGMYDLPPTEVKRSSESPMTLEHRSLTALIYSDEKFYVAQCPEIGTVSQGETVEDSLKNLQEATQLYLEQASLVIQSPIFVTGFVVDVQKVVVDKS